MPIESKHPDYVLIEPDWTMMKDTGDGERAVKEAGVKYLPPTAGMWADGFANTEDPGYKSWVAYKTRASFPNFTADAISAMVGLLHKDEAVIELPPQLEPLRTAATIDGESLQTLLMRINEAQFRYGRFGLLIDIKNGAAPGVLPYIASYECFNIINWDVSTKDDGQQELNLVVLDESSNVRSSNLEWEFKKKYRVIAKVSLLIEMGIVLENVPSGAQYAVAVFEGDGQSLASGEWVYPQVTGNGLSYLPFMFINANDLVPTPEQPPLLGLATKALSVYRMDADYRQQLFMQGQDTLVIIGRKNTDPTKQADTTRIGAGAFLELPIGGDAKYVGVSGQGLGEMRQALENDKKEAAELGGRLMDFGDSSRQSGDALRIRMASKTASMTGVAKAGAEGLAEALRIIAEWVGADPTQVVVKPNLKFADEPMTGEELLKLVGAKQMGAPIARSTIHQAMKERGLTQKTYEEEIEEIEAEEPLIDEPNPDDEDNAPGRGAPDEEEDEDGNADRNTGDEQ